MKKIIKNQGIATLPTVIFIGLMALAVVVSITTVALNELLISQGTAQSSGAILYAQLGARDALTRIARDKNYSCTSADCYSIDIVTGGCAALSNCAKVTVSSGTGATGNPKIITSKGIKGSSIRTVQVTVLLDGGASTNGAITTTTWTEL